MIFQNSSGTVAEAKGQLLDAAIAVSDNSHEPPLGYYLLVRLGGDWHRLTLDEGVLFLEQTHAATEDKHEDDGDVLHYLPVPVGRILEFVVRGGEVQVHLHGGGVLVVSEDPKTSLLNPTVIDSP